MLNLVDLAGSEKAKNTKATGNRLKEGTKIKIEVDLEERSFSKFLSTWNSELEKKNEKLFFKITTLTG